MRRKIFFSGGCIILKRIDNCLVFTIGLDIGSEKTAPGSIETSPVKQYLHSFLFVPRSRKKRLFVQFCTQPITASVVRFNATCDWPTTAAATTHAVCGVEKNRTCECICVKIMWMGRSVYLHGVWWVW